MSVYFIGMRRKINASKIRQELEAEKEANKSGKVTLYLNLGLYKRFKEACGDDPASAVIEKLMEAFIEGT